MLHPQWKQKRESSNNKNQNFQPKKSLIDQLYFSRVATETNKQINNVQQSQNHAFKTPQQRFKQKRQTHNVNSVRPRQKTATQSKQTSSKNTSITRNRSQSTGSQVSTHNWKHHLSKSKQKLDRQVEIVYKKMDELMSIVQRRRFQKQTIISTNKVTMKIRGQPTSVEFID